MSITVFGISNCDQIKKTLAWFGAQGVPVVFHDYKKSPPTPELLRHWLEQVDASSLINRRGTTWKSLSDTEKSAARSASAALELMLARPSIIRRPVLSFGGAILVGYDPDAFASRLSSSQ